MSKHEEELMDTTDMDDAESKYFQEVSNYDDNTDQSSGSFQGSLSVPTFNVGSDNLQNTDVLQAINQSDFKVDLSTLALQGSQGFQTLDQSAGGHHRDIAPDANCLWQNQGSERDQVIYMLTNEQLIRGDAFSVGLIGSQEHQPDSGELKEETDCTAEISFDKISNRETDQGLPVFLGENNTESTYQFASYSGMQLPLTTESQSQVLDPCIMQMASNTSGTDGGSQERSPKRRQRKSRSSSHQTSELTTQKSDSGRPSLSPNRGEHGSADGQASTELGFKPSLLEEILTEKKLALLRSPEVIQFLQSQQQQQAREKNVMFGQHIDKS